MFVCFFGLFYVFFFVCLFLFFFSMPSQPLLDYEKPMTALLAINFIFSSKSSHSIIKAICQVYLQVTILNIDKDDF